MIGAFIFAALAAAQAEPPSTIGEWRIACRGRVGAYDRCTMTMRGDGSEIEVIRTYAGAEFRASLQGCRGASVPPETRTREQLTGDGATDMFAGGVIGSFVRASRACARPPSILSVGRRDIPALLAATAGLRPQGE